MLLIRIGSILLLFTAMLHILKGYPRLTKAISEKKINLPSFSQSTRNTMSHEELKVMWLAFGIHLAILALMAFWLSYESGNTSKITLYVLGLIPIINGILLKLYIKGIHLGAPLLDLAGLLIIIGAVLT